VTTIRPPQRGPQQGSVCSGDRLRSLRRFRLLARRHAEHVAGFGDQPRTIAVGEQAVMADALEPFGQHMHQEPPDELIGGQRHCLEASGAVDAVIL